MANSTDKRETIMPDVLKTNTSVNARALSFVNHLSGCLLELKAFDLSKNTLVQILHTILIGTAKYLINELVKEILKPYPGKLKRLANGLKEHNILTGLSRKFTQLLRHSGSFLGRDFKMLLQTLSVVLLRDFSNDKIIDPILQVESKFEKYIVQVKYAVNSLIVKLHEFDMANVENPKHLPLSTKLKTHSMTHLTEDIRQFGPVLNFETEKDKQFNKDVCHKFAKQKIMQHNFANGSWINSNRQGEYSGPGIAEFIKSNYDKDKTFYNLFLRESQVLTDNNDTSNITTLKDNFFSAFVIKNSIGTTLSIGLISDSMTTFL
ncbi:hypothetical protein J3Q64DRAFT_1865991 [Phycomyces blakesleeanus]|uniref:Uncharacterized protein n=2 Tax=Phycomyces blakesleeanus TaxID=4837 RepID=A0A167JW44_PHYB8|nr:hypothetical protein PHYBLDRAFT_174825 [Phycomyces blakesleeanus NRRL 1555(-)]OAD66799.1 hypothetical protein PHYBLDRAFT_174825 [Phycomyces blakesleeanus NRRL 1555(-)]|eukprot:XP_018284839.1 hypothetical protein PHYBLDRAFT_174825 [Phycomyces blakesleeanus NRRL 1555(-)]